MEELPEDTLPKKSRTEYKVVNDKGTHYVYADSYECRIVGFPFASSTTADFKRDDVVVHTIERVKSIEVNAPLDDESPI